MSSKAALYRDLASRDFVQLKPHHVKKAFESSSTTGIRDLLEDAEFWRGYASEEEVASPIENDDCFSLDSNFTSEDETHLPTDASASPQLSDGSKRKLLHADQHCARAQAVQVVCAGKAKVVSMPKLSDRSPPREPFRPAQDATVDENIGDFSPVSEPGRPTPAWPTRSPRSPTTFSPKPSSYPSSLPTTKRPPLVAFGTSSTSRQPSQGRQLRLKANVLPLNSAYRAQSPLKDSHDPSPPRYTSFLQHYYYAAPPSSHSPDSPTSYHQHQASVAPVVSPSATSPSTGVPRSLHRFASNFSLRSLTRRPRRSNSSGASSEDLECVKESGLSTSALSPTTPPVASSPTAAPATNKSDVTIKTETKPRPKMIPRGASERAPVIVLPPCPLDDEDEAPPSFPPRTNSKHATKFHDSIHEDADDEHDDDHGDEMVDWPVFLDSSSPHQMSTSSTRVEDEASKGQSSKLQKKTARRRSLSLTLAALAPATVQT